MACWLLHVCQTFTFLFYGLLLFTYTVWTVFNVSIVIYCPLQRNISESYFCYSVGYCWRRNSTLCYGRKEDRLCPCLWVCMQVCSTKPTEEPRLPLSQTLQHLNFFLNLYHRSRVNMKKRNWNRKMKKHLRLRRYKCGCHSQHFLQHLISASLLTFQPFQISWRGRRLFHDGTHNTSRKNIQCYSKQWKLSVAS